MFNQTRDALERLLRAIDKRNKKIYGTQTSYSDVGKIETCDDLSKLNMIPVVMKKKR